MGAVFVGREREMAALEEATSRLALVTGEPGIGKTRLVEELARAREEAGWTIAWGRSWEGEGTPAYFPWTEAMRGAGRAEAWARLLESGGGASDPLEARVRLFDGVRALLAAMAEERPLLVVLDDLHAADTSTLALVHFLARHTARTSRFAIIGTTRDANYHRSEEGTALLAKIAREAQEIPLGRLAREDVGRWLATVAPELVASLDRVHAVSEGNPLFVGELVASARRRPDRTWSTAHAMPIGIREAIRAHLALLGEATASTLAVASVLGREVPLAILTAIAPEDPRAAIDDAKAAGVLVETADHRLRFTHVLVREELYARLPTERRAALHRDVAERVTDPGVAASHWILGARAEDAAQAAAAVRAAIRRAVQQLAFDDAAALGERAIASMPLPPALEGAIAVDVGEAYRFVGKDAPARAAAARAATIARAIGDPALFGRAALVHVRDVALGDRDVESIELLREALRALGDEPSVVRVQVMARLSAAVLPTPDEAEHAEALRLRRDAIDLARRIGDDDALFAALRLATVAFPEGDAATRHARNAEAIALARRLGRVPQVVQLLTWQVANALDMGDPDRAAGEIDTMASLLEGYPQPSFRWRVPLARAMLANLEGRFDEALAIAAEVQRFAEAERQIPALMLIHAQNTGFLYTRGDPDGAIPVPSFANLSKNPVNEAFASLTLAAIGDHERARAALARIDALPLSVMPGVTSLGWPAVELGDTVRSARLYDLLVEEEDEQGPWLFGPAGIVSVGPRALLVARIDALLGREDAALRALPRALDIAERLRARPWIAQIELTWAELLARRDRAAARGRAARAHAIATELGMKRVAARAAALAGSMPPAPPPSKRTRDAIALVREGETWRIEAGGRSLVLEDRKGLVFLDALVRDPCRPIHVLELAGIDDRGDAGPVLDERAKRDYRERAASLHEVLEEATRNADLGRVERARSELDALAAELAAAVGLGGRDRRAASPAERARINVQRRLRDVITRVTELDRDLGLHLQRSVRTGMFCVYLPVWEERG